MTEQEVNIYSIAYRDCKEVSDSIDANEELGKASVILFYMDEILEALKIASELQAIGTIEEFKKLKDTLDERLYEKLIYSKVKEDSYNKAIDEFTEKAMHKFTEFDLQHGYPTVADCEIILRDLAEQMKGE